ncbi:hypothetical protein [Mycolicibacterium sp. CBMA 226]|uniref:hypothetical protein n=1 Tax=Mycolicibacterium sp. CBMA 226 TaxID=2606611 RepID=UPI0012DFDB2D|nr:hypothetical protein [Mycolicibacterium sp. CBMA 226]MUL76440.1 hypothetical protein [Mycolicibacterium sp. CBMA 226]
MPYVNLLDDPLFGDHQALVLGWEQSQLTEIVACLQPLLKGRLTDEMHLAVASIARSIVAEHEISGRPVHYARAKTAYGEPERYRNGDPWHTWHYMTGGVDALHRAGLVDHALGQWHFHRESIATATDKLVKLLVPLIRVWEPRGLARRSETIVLRDRDKRAIDYAETPDTLAMREDMAVLNERLAELEVHRDGDKFPTPRLRRVFNGDFDRGGRLYCYGASHQSLSPQERANLTIVIGGVAHPVVEIDYANLHVAIAYFEAGQLIPPGDQYLIEGFDRDVVKLAANVLFNAGTTREAIGAIAHKLDADRSLRWASGIDTRDQKACRDLARELVDAVRRKHAAISSYFASDCGARFQRADSDIAVAVMTDMVDKTGRCPLPVHDSFLVADIDADHLKRTMVEVADQQGLKLNLKDSREIRKTPEANT